MIEPGDVINNHYYVIEELGDGNFGKTFEVTDKKGNSKVLKILKSNFSNVKVLELFEQEYHVLKKLNHPGIPAVKTGGYLTIPCPHTSEILHGLVMEKIQGEDLEKWMEKNQRIPNQKQALDWLKQLIDILAHIHSKNYLHRDIKPKNIMLKPDGQLVLIDFGAVKEFTQKNQKKINSNTKIGTSGYRSPEQENGTDLTATSDFFSLGRTFVHLLTGIHPSNLPQDRQAANLIWQNKAPQVLNEFKDLIDYLMEYEPSKRPKNTAAILQDIQEIEDIISPRNFQPFPEPFVLFSFLLNMIFMVLLSMGFTLSLGLKIFFIIAVCVIAIFLILPLIKYLF